MDIWRLLQLVDLTLFNWRSAAVCLPSGLLLMLIVAAWCKKAGCKRADFAFKKLPARTVLFCLAQLLLYVCASYLSFSVFKSLVPPTPNLASGCLSGLTAIGIVGPCYFALQLLLFKINSSTGNDQTQLKFSPATFFMGWALMPFAVAMFLLAQLSPRFKAALALACDRCDKYFGPFTTRCASRTNIPTAAAVAVFAFCGTQLVLLAATLPALVGHLDLQNLRLAQNSTLIALATSSIFVAMSGMMIALSTSDRARAMWETKKPSGDAPA